MATSRDAARLLGVDAARGLALVGMMSVHVLPSVGDDGGTTAAHLIAGGRSSALFALLAGVGLALANGRSTPPRGRALARSAVGTAARAVVLIVIGLLLGALDSGVAVILVYYGLLFLVAVPFLGLGPRVLLPLAGLWAVAMPLLSHVWRESMPLASYDNPTVESLADPGALVRELALTGYYPVLPWTAYILAGLGIGRLTLARTSTATTLLIGGAALAVVTWVTSTRLLDSGGLDALVEAGVGTHPVSRPFVDGVLTTGFYGTTPTTSVWWLTIASPHSGTPFDLLHTIGAAMAVLGAMLLLAKVARAVVWPVAAVGSMTLTLYTLHVVLLSTLVPRESANAFATHVAIAFAVAMPWRAFVGRGPLEALTARVSARAREFVPATSGGDHRRPVRR